MSDVVSRIADQRKVLSELRTALKLESLVAVRAKLEADMEQPDFWTKQEVAQKTVARLKDLRSVIDPWVSVEKRLKDVEELHELAVSEKDADALKECGRELDQSAADLEKLKLRALFTGENDGLGAYINIQAGTGGLDACDWANMVLRMVSRYSEKKGWGTPQLMEMSREPEAGIKQATLLIEARGAYGWLKSEQGTHRLVRISPFDAQSRRQTAFAAVEVLPAFDDDVAIDVKEVDCSWEFFASGGPGGQHVNKTQSGARVRHKPSGLMVQCTEERSQGANKRRALKILASKLATIAEEERAKAAHAGYQNKSTMGFGASDRVRSYTLQPFTLAKDHRTAHQTADVQRVLDGDLEPFVEAYLKWRASGGKPAGTGDDDAG